MRTILVIDDDDDVLIFLKYNLEKEGFNVTIAQNAQIGLEIAKNIIPDLILLDVMMPKMDGVELCEILRTNNTFENTIICFLTARSEDYSHIAGLEAGADDYISKPIKPKLLITRINTLLRRKTVRNKVNNNSNELVIDREKYIVIKDNIEIKLPRKEFELVSLLSTKPNVVFERNYILEKVWGNEIIVGDRTIDVHVRKIREKIGNDYIKTIKGVGYKLEYPK